MMAWNLQRGLTNLNPGGSSFPLPTAGQYNSPAFQAFLAQHPELAQAAREGSIDRFLSNHPAIATAYRNLLAPAAPTPAAPSTPAAGAVQAPADPAAAATTAATQQSASSSIDAWLGGQGLGGIGTAAWNRYLELGGASNPGAEDVVYQEIRSGAAWTGGAYARRYPGMDALAKQGRAITEGQYQTLESQYVETARMYGLPATFYDDPSDFGNLIANNVSPREYDDRLKLAARYSNDSPQAAELRDEFSRLYGPIAGQGAAIAYMIDPTKALDVLQRQHEAAQAASVARQTGFGTLSKDQAELVAGYGVSQQQEQQTFSQLAGLGELRRDLPGMAPDAVDDSTALSAGFGQNADAQRRIERAGKGRVAALQGGGGPARTQRGVVGLGSAAT